METIVACEQSDLIRWAVSIAIPAIAGLVGVVIGAWLTGRREQRQRRMAFVEKQLKDFYSPMLGLRNEIHMRSDLRVRIHDAADVVWRNLCAQAREVSTEALGELSRSRSPEFTKLILISYLPQTRAGNGLNAHPESAGVVHGNEFQSGLSMRDFQRQYGTNEQCEAAVFASRRRHYQTPPPQRFAPV